MPALRPARLTALHCGVLSSLVPHFLYPPALRRWREGVRDIDPRPHNGPGGCPPRTPGTTIAKSWARAPIPIHIQFRLQDAPQANGDMSAILMGPVSVKAKI